MVEENKAVQKKATRRPMSEAAKKKLSDKAKERRAAVRTTSVLTESTEMPRQSAPVAQTKDTEIVWFTEVDYNDKGKVASDYPAYYFDTKELKEEIRKLSEQLDDGVFQGKRKRDNEQKLADRKDRLDKIENGRPKLVGATKDKVVREMKELGDLIRDSMFSYDSHWKMTADPHVVAERMVTPCIDVKNEHVASFARQRGYRIENGKISQNDASVIFKTMAKLVGESSDTDRLRPIREHGTTI